MSQNVGDIGLGLTLDQKGFGLQTKSLERMAKRAGRKIGTALAAGLSVKALASFTKSCLDLGSDLQEVQNVVDTAFPGMSAQVDAFAKSAATSFGLSETMAKKYVGTFGAMSKSFGFTEREAYAMSTALTGLAGDVASFYNMSQDEAYTKLKSVFTGETESLKDLGVVMTQANLDQFALANGFGKTTAAMTEQEKVALRYKFVVDQLSLANGDFAKTSNSWANQVRILTLQFESFKAALGQGFINILTPVIQMINTLMTRLVALANSFKSFTELITGKKSQNTGFANTANDADALATSADNASDSVSNIGDTAKKTANKLKRSLFGFDQINKVDSKDSSSSSSSGPTGASTAGVDTGLTGAMKEQTEQSKLLGAGYEALRASVARLKESFSNFVSVIVSGVKWAWENILKPLGKWTLQELAPRLINILAGAFDVLTACLKAAAPIFETLWNVFLKPIAKFTGKLILKFLDLFSGALTGLANFISKHPTIFQGVLTSIMGLMAISKVSKVVNGFRVSMKNAGSIAGGLADKFPKIAKKVKALKPVLKAVFSPKSLIVLGIMAAVTAGILLYKNWDKIKKAAKKIGKQILKPFKAIGNFFKKTWKNALEKGSDIIEDMRDRIKGVIGGLKTYFSGWIDFITGIFSGNWEKAWGGVKDIFSGIWDAITSALNLPDIDVVATLSAIKDAAFDKVSEAWHAIKDKGAELLANAKEKAAGALETLKNGWESVKDKATELVANAKEKTAGALAAIKDKWEAIKGKTAELVANAKEGVAGALDTLKEKWAAVKTKAAELVATAKNNASGVLDTLKSAWSAIKDKAATLTGNATNKNDKILSALKSAWSTVKTKTAQLTGKASNKNSGVLNTLKDRWSKIKSKTANLTAKAVNKNSSTLKTLKDAWSTFKSKTVQLTAKFKDVFTSPLKSVWNAIAKKINNAITTINKIPGVNIKGRVPYLAQGGYVKKNTPQLAVIGDNRHQGEVVAPEDKLLQMARQAAAMSGGGTSPEVLELLRAILKAIEALEFEVYLDGKSIKKRVVDLINANTTATGVCELIV